MDKIIIFDTTLRDGEQTPGISLNVNEKISIAKQLAKLGVDVIEPGFPLTSPGDFEAVQRISREIEGPTICGFSRAILSDIDKTWEAIKDAYNKCFHIFISSSYIQIKHQLDKNEQEVIDIVRKSITHAKNYTDEIEFSPMDASRTRMEFLYEIVETAIECGATVINIPDTVGYSTPLEFHNIIKNIKNNVRNIDNIILSVHCHNDLGMAVANSLAAVSAGARQIECTINGIGERAGNAALEEIIMQLTTRKDYYNFETNIDTRQLYTTSKLVSKYSGIPIPVNKPIVGKNVFIHESGIHQDGVLKERETYEIINPKDVGIETQGNIILGKHSGKHALKKEAKKLGYELTDEQLINLFNDFKLLVDKKKKIKPEDLEALIIGEITHLTNEIYVLEEVEIYTSNFEISNARVKIKDNKDNLMEAKGEGNGPIEATFNTIKLLIEEAKHLNLNQYRVSSISNDFDSLGEVVVVLKDNTETYLGKGLHPNIIVSSANAYISALNKYICKNTKTK